MIMDATIYFSLIFLGLLGFSWLCHQVYGIIALAWRPTSRWFRRRLILPRVLHGQHLFNPSRAEVACHVVHWASIVIFNTFKVSNVGEAASRAAFAAIVHLLPLVLSSQMNFVSHSFGISPSVGASFHTAFGWMAAVQGALHGTLKLLDTKDWTWQTRLGLLALCSLVALSCFPFARSRAYETFLAAHRVLTLVMAVASWLHLKPQESIPHRLYFTALILFLVISGCRYAMQAHRNISFIQKGLHFIRIEEVRKYDECLIVALRLPRQWWILPGQHVFLTILTFRCASILQRHPFTVTWWNDLEPSQIYLMIRSRRGWTKSVTHRSGILNARNVWLDGPFGIPLHLENYGAVLLFASGDGIFAQLPLIKGLTEAYKSSRSKTRRIKLVWLTTEFNEQLQEWIQSILDDEHLHTSLLDISIHQPVDTRHVSGRSKINSLGRRLKMIYDVPNVKRYLQTELRHLKTDIAVTVSGYPQLRHHVRNEVLKIDRYKVRLFELDFQPHDKGQYNGGIAA